MSQATEMLRVEGLTHAFGGVKAVDNCTFSVRSGAITALIGPNVKRSYKSSQSYRHENTLRTILEALAVDGYPGASQYAKPMRDFFN